MDVEPKEKKGQFVYFSFVHVLQGLSEIFDKNP